MEITKDALKAFKIIYCEFKRRRKAGFTKIDSLTFSDGELESLPAFSKWLKPDIQTAFEELKSAKYLKEDIIGNIKITDSGLLFMENKPKEFFNDLTNLFDIVSLFI